MDALLLRGGWFAAVRADVELQLAQQSVVPVVRLLRKQAERGEHHFGAEAVAAINLSDAQDVQGDTSAIEI